MIDDLPMPVLTVTAPPLPPKGKKIPQMEKRRRALESVRARFERQGFAWGRGDCVALARTMAVAMGHTGLPKLPRYRNAEGAKAALTAMGVETVEELLDQYFERIAPAEMLMGDLGLVESELPEFGGTVVVSVGFKTWGWHPDLSTFAILEPTPDQFKAAWRL